MKKFSIILLVALGLSSCNNRMNQAMKSADKDFILETANEYFAKKKWGKALSLYDRLPNLVAGTDDAPNVVYNSAYANYYQKNYRLAGHQFKNFSASYPDDARREEASYMAALCYYEGSLDYNLDQTNTDLAINELQDFINKYPNSERSKNINQLIEELMYKQEFKAYENAKQYFKMGLYKSSDIAFENVLEDFPATKLRPKIYDYILKSKYELAVNSKFDLKKERLNNAEAYTKFIEKELPNTEYSKTAVALREKLEREKEKFIKLEAEVEAHKATVLEKQKAEQKKQEEKKVEKEQKNLSTKEEVSTETKSSTTFKIRR